MNWREYRWQRSRPWANRRVWRKTDFPDHRPLRNLYKRVQQVVADYYRDRSPVLSR